MSNTKCVESDAKALTEPLVVGTIAMFEVTAASKAFSVETRGCAAPCGHNVR
jgi:hypothetical protein